MDKYTLNLGANNYVLSISHTSNDNVELDLSQVDARYLNAYQLVNGKLALDEAKKQTIIEAEKAREKTPTQIDRIEAQVLYTALMTDTILKEV